MISSQLMGDIDDEKPHVSVFKTHFNIIRRQHRLDQAYVYDCLIESDLFDVVDNTGKVPYYHITVIQEGDTYTPSVERYEKQ